MPPGDESHQMPRRKIRSSSLEYSTTNDSSPRNTRIEGRYTTGSRFNAVDDILEDSRPHTSVVRLSQQPSQVNRTTAASFPTTTVPQRRQAATTNDLPRQAPRTTTYQPPKNAPRQPKRNAASRPSATHHRIHWLLPLGVGMLAMLAIWITGSWALAWAHQVSDDVHYGNPRTYQVDAVVGHGTDATTHPSHFVAINLNRQAVVFEMVAGDPAKSISYVAPIYIAGDGGDKAPVTLEFRDVNGDGKLDMIIHIHLPAQEQLSVFLNDGNKFRPSTNNDKIHL